MTFPFARCCCLSLLLLFPTGFVRGEENRNDKYLNLIKQTWSARQAKIQSIDIEWKEVQTVKAEMISIDDKHGQALPFPPRDVTNELQCSLKSIGKQFRSERNGPHLIPVVNDYCAVRTLIVSNGTVHKSFWGGDQTGKKRFTAVGWIHPDIERLVKGDGGVLPIIQYCRPFDPVWGFGLDQEKIAASFFMGFEHIQGNRCIVLKNNSDRRECEYSIDLENGCLLRRYIIKVEGHLRVQYDLDYKPESEFKFVPAGWTLSIFADSLDLIQPRKLTDFTRATVTSIKINTPTKPADFAFDFPVNTRVIDSVNKTEYQQVEPDIPVEQKDAEKPDDTKADNKAADAEAMDPFGPFLACDLIFKGYGTDSDSSTSVQRAEAEAELLAQVKNLPWTVPLIVWDVSLEPATGNYRLAFKGIDPTVGKLSMRWQAGGVSIPLSKAEALKLKVGQVVYLRGEPQFTQPEDPVAQELLRLIASPRDSRDSKPKTRHFFLKNVKLITAPKPADKKESGKAENNNAAATNPQDRFRPLYAYDDALSKFGPQLDSLTSVQRDEANSKFDVQVADLSKTPWTVPLVIQNVEQFSGNFGFPQQGLYKIKFKKIDDSVGKLKADWQPSSFILPLAKAEALALKIGQVVYLTGAASSIAYEGNTFVEGFPRGQDAYAIRVINFSSREDNRTIQPTRVIYFNDVKLTTE